MWLLAAAYCLLVAVVFSIGVAVEQNATETQAKVCATAKATALAQLEIGTYLRQVLGAEKDQALADETVAFVNEQIGEVCEGVVVAQQP